MPLLDAFMAALVDRKTGQVNPFRLAEAIGRVAGGVANFGDVQVQGLVTQLIGPWAIGVARHAPTKWLLPTNVPPACALELNAHHQVCGAFAIGGCHACGRPICLAHALVAADATIVCWQCMRVAAKHTTPWAPAIAQQAESPGVQWAYDLLGLKTDCTLEEAKKAFKVRIARFHPDRVAEGEDSAPNGDLVRSLKSAYDAIVKDKKRVTR